MTPATGEMEYGLGKRKHGKKTASIEQSSQAATQ